MRTFPLLLLCALPFAAGAQTLTEAEALRLGLARAEVHDLERGTRALAEAEVIAAGAWPNPTLDVERERMRTTPRGIDETWKLAQTFELSGRRGLRIEAAERRVEAAGAQNAARREELAAEIRRRFHAALHAQQLVKATEAWLGRFLLIESRIEKQVGAGEISGYDRRRLARERQTAAARLAL
ncbi:MAG: TolC family protein, partial [Sulfuritalea sp.]|nr:TolC family protein [Sulfuritalea sp.]